jgi:glutamine cyclotransferase
LTSSRIRSGYAVTVLWILALLWLAGASIAEPAPTYGYEVVNVYPHEVDAFTQGLIVADSVFYEGTGLYGQSTLRKVDIETGTVLKQYNVSDEYFGEGITEFADTIYQLTYQEHVTFAYVESDTFALVDSIPYAWEGWGLTHDGTHLIASDGSPTIRFLHPGTLEEVSQILVQDDGEPIHRLNELEYIEGKIYSNIWYRDEIAVVNPVSGDVEAWLDLAGLADSVADYPGANVLNGIAFDPEENRLFVTGKWWPKLFEIDVPTLSQSDVEEVLPSYDEPSRLRSYPNPSSQSIHLTFVLSGPAHVSIHVYDLRGRLVSTLLDERRPVGRSTVPLDVGGMNPGVYFARVASQGVSRTTKLVVVE